MKIENDTSLEEAEGREAQSPSVPITTDDKSIVYESQPIKLQISGHPILRLRSDAISRRMCKPGLVDA